MERRMNMHVLHLEFGLVILNILSELITCRLVTRNTSTVSQLDGEDEVTPLSPLNRVFRVTPLSFLEVAQRYIAQFREAEVFNNVRVKVYFNITNT
jgi:hypothetical protein